MRCGRPFESVSGLAPVTLTARHQVLSQSTAAVAAAPIHRSASEEQLEPEAAHKAHCASGRPPAQALKAFESVVSVVGGLSAIGMDVLGWRRCAAR